MPRNMSFAMTTNQIRNRTKTVTRRRGWQNLKVGTILQACVKCLGLPKGEKIEKLCRIWIVDVRRERLRGIHDELDGTKAEGFPEMSPGEFCVMFCRHMGDDVEQIVTRIEFEYVDPPSKG